MSMMEPGWIWELSGRDFIACVLQSGLLDRNSNERRPYARPVLKLKQECKRKMPSGYSLCECGALKGRVSKMCKACRYRLAAPPKPSCADCGVAIFRYSKRCTKCDIERRKPKLRFCECGAVLTKDAKRCRPCHHQRRAAAKIVRLCACGALKHDRRSKSCSSCAAKERYARYGAVILQRGKAA